MVRRALFRKLLRDLWHTRSQGIAISLVIAAGVAMFVAYFSTFDSLRLAQQTYYDRFRFADVFVTLKRAPLGLVDDLAGDSRRRSRDGARRPGCRARHPGHARAGDRAAHLAARRRAADSERAVPSPRPAPGSGRTKCRQRRVRARTRTSRRETSSRPP